MLNTDCLSYITTWLHCKEHCTFMQVNKEFKTIKISERRKQEYLSGRIVLKFTRSCVAHRQIIERFIDKCYNDPAYRSRYLFVHMTEDPHICFRTFPAWLESNMYRQHVQCIVAKRPGLMDALYNYVDMVTEIIL